MNFTKNLAVASVALGLSLVSGAASAVAIGLTGGSNVSGYGNTRSFTDIGATVSVTASAWANTGAAGVIETANLGTWGSSGLGVCDQGTPAKGSGSEKTNCSDPEHTVDNHYAIDSVLFSFDKYVDLQSVKFGYVHTDSDFSLLRYDGSDTLTSLASLTYAGMVAGDWTLVSNYNPGSSTTSIPENGTNTSKYWLVAAYSSVFGIPNNHAYTGNDYFKISGLDVIVPVPTQQSPEPATLSLLGLGLAGIGFMRRRRK